MKTNVEWGEAESKVSGTNVLYQARTYNASLLAGGATHGLKESASADVLILCIDCMTITAQKIV